MRRLNSVYDNRPLYVPPNPHDGGLSLGHLFRYTIEPTQAR